MRSLRACLLIAGLALSSGCAGYKLGPTNGVEAGAKTIQLVPFSNQTFQLANDASADIVVTGTLIDYDRRELSLVRNDVLTVSDFRVNVKARVAARDRTTGNVLFDREVTGYTLVRVGSDLTSSERQALPVLAEDLAKNITSLLVDGSW